MLSKGASLLVDLIYFFENFDCLSLLLEEVLVFNGKTLTPKLLIFLLLLVHLGLFEQFLAAVLVSAVGPVEPRLNLMAEHVRFQPLSDVAVVYSFEVVSELVYSFSEEDYILVPFLVNEALQSVEVACYLVG